MSLILELLDKKKHDTKHFDCGEDEMNIFFKQFAFKNQKLELSKSWVLTNDEKKEDSQAEKLKVMGYFTFTAQTISPALIKIFKVKD